MSRHLILFFGLFNASTAFADGYLDWVPEYSEVQSICETSLTDLIGAAGITTTALSAAGLTSTTITATPFATAFMAGESGLVIVSGTSISVVSAPVIGTGATIAAAAVSTAYVGTKGVCALSGMLARTHVTNEPIPLVMLLDNRGIFTSTEDALQSEEAVFVATSEIIPAGTPVFSLGILSEAEAVYYPGYQGRGLVQLGQFFDHDYFSKIPEDERGFAVVPANSLNTILRDNFTHQFNQDVYVERNGDVSIVPAGTAFELHRLRDDGWAKIELADGWNIWIEDLSSAEVISREIIEQSIGLNLNNQ